MKGGGGEETVIFMQRTQEGNLQLPNAQSIFSESLLIKRMYNMIQFVFNYMKDHFKTHLCEKCLAWQIHLKWHMRVGN